MTDKEEVSEDKEASGRSFAAAQSNHPFASNDNAEPIVGSNGQAETPQYSFEQLAHGCSMIQIVFAGREYSLRRTRAGKLVLNK